MSVRRPHIVIFNPDQWRGDVLGHMGNPAAVEDPWYSMIDRAKVPPRVPTPGGWKGKPSLLKGIWQNQRLHSWTEDRWQELRATYYGMCARTDHQTRDGLYWPRLVLQRGDGPEHTKAVMCRTREWKYVRRLYESDELYDLRHDPQELDNRINDPACAGALAAMKDRLLTFFMETGDVVPFDTDRRW